MLKEGNRGTNPKNGMIAVENGPRASESKKQTSRMRISIRKQKRTPHWVSIYHHAQRVYHQYPWVLYIIRRGRHIIRPLRSVSRERDKKLTAPPPTCDNARVVRGWHFVQPRSVQNKGHPDAKEIKKEHHIGCPLFWSGLRGSNPPPPPWQGGALPNELNPHKWCLRSESNQRHEDFQSSALPTELQRHRQF